MAAGSPSETQLFEQRLVRYSMMEAPGRLAVSRTVGASSIRLRRSTDQSLARSVVRGTAVAEEVAKFGVSHIISPLADFGTDGTNADTVHHPARETSGTSVDS